MSNLNRDENLKVELKENDRNKKLYNRNEKYL